MYIFLQTHSNFLFSDDKSPVQVEDVSVQLEKLMPADCEGVRKRNFNKNIANDD